MSALLTQIFASILCGSVYETADRRDINNVWRIPFILGSIRIICDCRVVDFPALLELDRYRNNCTKRIIVVEQAERCRKVPVTRALATSQIKRRVHAVRNRESYVFLRSSITIQSSDRIAKQRMKVKVAEFPTSNFVPDILSLKTSDLYRK